VHWRSALFHECCASCCWSLGQADASFARPVRYCRHRDPIAIDLGSITLDTDAVNNLTITLSGTGELDLMGLNGWASATFTLTTFQSGGTGSLFGLGGDSFVLLPYGGEVEIETLELFAVGNRGPTPDYSVGYTMPTSAVGMIQLSADEVALTLEGVGSSRTRSRDDGCSRRRTSR
jgi:hypothetical protein